MRTSLRVLLTLGTVAAGLASTSSSEAITRDEVMVRARAFAYHPWRCEQQNLTASCDAAYQSYYTPGDYVGLPYDWGGYITLFDFDQEIGNGAGAGTEYYDELECTVGLDCSGYVSKCWDAGHMGTSTLQDASTVIQQSQVLPGDVFNKPNNHVILFSHELANGDPILYEALIPNVHINPYGGWAYTSSFTPRRYDGITGTTAGNPVGTPDNPIEITSFPYTDSRDTTQSSSDVLDGCGAMPGTDESGPEYIYQVTFTQPGQLTVGVSDDIGVDIDVHLYTSMNTDDCIERHDSTFTTSVDCGTYYIVADTYGSGLANAGPYTLNVSFAPSSSACGSGPAGYDPTGYAGGECAFDGHEDLPMCNPNLGGEVCIYTSGSSPISFCSHPCASASDCGEFPGGCCEDIGSGEFYCLPSSLCGGPTPDAGPATDAALPDGAPTEAAPPPPDGSSPDAPGQPDSNVGVDGAPIADGGFEEDGAVLGADGGLLEGTSGEDDNGGCSCRTSRPRGSAFGALAAFAAALLFARRRRS
jgi:MYXO-CTERM domain-containing protein